MTIKVIIKNDDSRENATIRVTMQELDTTVQDPYLKRFKEASSKQLKGGESTEEWVHNERQIVIDEVQNG